MNLITIEKIRVDKITAYIYVKILSTTPAEENKPYRFYIERTDRDYLTFDLLDTNRYWIDHYTGSDSLYNIGINRNKTIVLRYNLLRGIPSKGFLVSSFRIHLKEEKFNNQYDPSIWVSDVLRVSTEQIALPEIKCLGVQKTESGTLKTKVELTYPDSQSLRLGEFYLTPIVKIMDRTNSYVLEEIKNSEDMVFESTKEYELKVAYLKIALQYPDGTIAKTQSFARYVGENYIAFIITQKRWYKCNSISIKPGKKVKKFIKKIPNRY